MIVSFLGRAVHCGSTEFSAVRQVITHYWPDGKFRSLLDRNQRRFAIASIILAHRRNANEYSDVMRRTHKGTPKCPYLFNPSTKQVTIK